MTARSYSMHDLERLSGVAARTLRQWIRVRLLPPPLGKARAARYDDRHLVRAQVALTLRRQGLSLRAVGDKLNRLGEDELLALVPPRPRPTNAAGVPLPPPAPSYPASTWEVVQIMDGLSLLVSTQLGPLPRHVADDIYRHYALLPGGK